VRADAPWCTQCFLNLRTPASEPAPIAPIVPVVPAQPEVPEPRPAEARADEPLVAQPPAYAAPAELPDGTDPLTAPLHVLEGTPAPADARSWPCTSCGTPNGFDLDACSSCGQGFLAALSETGGLLVLPGVGDLAALSKGKRTAIALGAVLAVMALVALIGLLLG
jgi:hypothetical protein